VTGGGKNGKKVSIAAGSSKVTKWVTEGLLKNREKLERGKRGRQKNARGVPLERSKTGQSARGRKD